MTRHLAVASVLLGLAACSRPDATQESPPRPLLIAEVRTAEDAVAAARRCIDADPRAFRSVWGSTLMVDAAFVSRTRSDDWFVSIPESGLSEDGRSIGLGAPQGLDLIVDHRTRACTHAPMD